MTAVVHDLDRPLCREVEVATVSADALRASVRVSGPLGLDAASLLLSVLATHTGLGRRYLRVDLAAATLDLDTIGTLVRSHAAIRDLGGMLVFENAGPVLIDAIRSAQLFAATPADGS